MHCRRYRMEFQWDFQAMFKCAKSPTKKYKGCVGYKCCGIAQGYQLYNTWSFLSRCQNARPTRSRFQQKRCVFYDLFELGTLVIPKWMFQWCCCEAFPKWYANQAIPIPIPSMSSACWVDVGGSQSKTIRSILATSSFGGKPCACIHICHICPWISRSFTAFQLRSLSATGRVRSNCWRSGGQAQTGSKSPKDGMLWWFVM